MKFFTLVSSFIGKLDLLIPFKPSQSSNPSGCIISLITRKGTQKSRKGTNSFYCAVFGVVYNGITSCLKSYCSTSKNRTETARVSILFFVRRSICRHIILSIFLASCIAVSKRKRNLILRSLKQAYWNRQVIALCQEMKETLDSGLHPVDSGVFVSETWIPDSSR